MLSPAPRRAGRPAQRRVMENDARILDAGVAALAETGWSGLSFLNVATQARLSRRAMLSRYPDPSALAVAIWEQRCELPLRSALDDVVTAAAQSESALLQVLTAINRPSSELCAASELLLVSQFDDTLHAAIETGLGAHITDLCSASPTAQRPAAARRAYLLSVALGLLMASRANEGSDVNLTTEVAHLFAALQEPSTPQRMPRGSAKYLDEPADFATGDETLDSLLQSVLDHVGTRSFDRSSVDRIAAAAGCSTGALFARYPTKLELFLDATRRQQAMSMRDGQQYMTEVSEAHGAGIGIAVNIRESQRPARAHLRAIGLEQVRVSWHNEELRRARQQEIEAFVQTVNLDDPQAKDSEVWTWAYVGVALGIGIAVLPLLDEECWTLPYDVVTVPLARQRD